MSAAATPWAAYNAAGADPGGPSGASDKILSAMRDEILGRYERWLSATALASRTRTAYRRWVTELVDDLGASGELARFLSAGADDERRAALTDWRRRLVDRGLAPPTVNLALAAATSLLDAHALPSPPVARVTVAAGEPRALELDELRAVEKAVDALRSSRDCAIMAVLLRTGLRIGEVAALQRPDVHVTQRTGHVIVRHGKGDRYRVVPLSRSARHALQVWLVDRGAHPHAPADLGAGPLWLSRTGNALSARSINTIVSSVMNAAGIDDSAHALRHTLATRLVRDHGHDLVLVADVLGHRDVKTTARYVRSKTRDQRAALEAADSP